jgi:hypothetical protein
MYGRFKKEWFKELLELANGIPTQHTFPGAGAGPKGSAVRQLKGYVSWVARFYILAS